MLKSVRCGLERTCVRNVHWAQALTAATTIVSSAPRSSAFTRAWQFFRFRCHRPLDEFKSDAHFVKQQTEELIHNLNELSRRANEQMDDVHKIVRTARQWTERADRIVEEVEPPVFALARSCYSDE
jgi:methyl-accepting chemotaxis protein